MQAYNLEFFRRDDQTLDKVLKSISLSVAVLQFLNCFFGFIIGLDKDEFGPYIDSWGAYAFGIVVFYLFVMVTSFCAFLGTIQHWYRFMLGAAVLDFLYFFFGLFNIGLRANGFGFALLFFGMIIFAILGVHYWTVEQCKARGDHFTCRGRCIRLEKGKEYDDKFFGGKGVLLKILCVGATPESSEDSPQMPQQVTPTSSTHVSFTNNLHQEEANKTDVSVTMSPEHATPSASSEHASFEQSTTVQSPQPQDTNLLSL